MLTCREVTELVTDYVEDRLGEKDAERFRAHIAGCAQCTLYVRQVQAVVRAGRVAVPEPPAEVVDALARAFAARPPAKVTFTARMIRLFGGAWGFALAALLVAAVALHAILAGTHAAAIGAWVPCLSGQLIAGGAMLGVGARLARERAGAGGWAAFGALGATMSSVALAFLCPVEPTMAHLLVVHAGGVALAAALAGIARAALVPVRA